LNLAFYIARRYLFAKKSQNAINVISLISVCSVVVATVAMVCVLSVLNGFETLVASMFNNFDPELKIMPATGKVFDPTAASFQPIRQMPDIELFTEVLEENVMVRYRNRQEIAVAKGVSDNFRQMVSIDSLLIDGKFMLQEEDINYSALGIGLSSALGVRTGFTDPLEIYVPVRDRNLNMANVASAFQLEYAFISAEFCVNQAKYDESYMILPIDMMRRLLNYETEVTALELKLKPQANIKTVRQNIQTVLGDNFKVLDRFEQQASTYKMMRVEKFMVFLILAFILAIALFNVVSSLSMLMIEKQEDVKMLRSMGADDRLIRRIFLYEGSMIPTFGAVAGITIGVALCLVQLKFGLIKLGNMGAFLSNNYPVRIIPTDLLLIFTTVFAIGLFVSWYPVRYLGKKWLSAGRIAIAFLPMLLIGCQGLQNDRKSVAVTIEPQRYFVEKIAGEQYKVYTVVPVGQSPENYDPAPGEMIRIAQSAAYLQIGPIGFEQAWIDVIRQNNPDLIFFDLSKGIPMIGESDSPSGIDEHQEAEHQESATETHAEDLHSQHQHGGVDPHIWSSTSPAKMIALNTLQAFLKLDPENEAIYRENFRQLIQEINETELQMHAMLDTLSCRSFVIYHPALTYFAEEYGLNQLAIEAGGKEPSVASMKSLIDEAVADGVKVVFVQQEFDSKHAEQVAKEIGARTVVINPLDRHWREQMIFMANELIK
jgi:ABC-type lipoprotein release transport system permease subunit/ABC-type Zn uptake system ZnuABC Zn-binding protein ZnuA